MSLPITFDLVREFLESWGLGFGDSSNIPYPAVYHRMRDDAVKVGGIAFSKFIGSITETTDGESYLALNSWEEIQVAWEAYNQENP